MRGGRTLEAEILQRRSTLTSSWGVFTDTSDPVTDAKGFACIPGAP